MARSHPAPVLVLLAVAIAGCIGSTPQTPSADPQAPTTVDHLGTWENPDAAFVGVNATDVTGDGIDEVIGAQYDGTVTALEVNGTQVLWQDDYGYGLEDLTGVGGDRGPAVAVAWSDLFGDDDGRLTLIGAPNGTVLGERRVRDVDPELLVATDVDDDGVEDLIVVGETLRPDADPESGFFYPQTAVVAVDGGFDASDGLASEALSADQLWRRQLDGGPVHLEVHDDRIHVGTQGELVALDLDGEVVYQRETFGLEDVAVHDGRALAVDAEEIHLLDRNGDVVWSENLRGDSRRVAAMATVDGDLHAAVAGPGLGPESDRSESGSDPVGVAVYDGSGEGRFNLTVATLRKVADAAFVPLRPGAARLVVAGPTTDGDAGIAMIGPDGTAHGPAIAQNGDRRDELSTAAITPEAGREIVLAGYDGRLAYFAGR